MGLDLEGEEQPRSTRGQWEAARNLVRQACTDARREALGSSARMWRATPAAEEIARLGMTELAVVEWFLSILAWGFRICRGTFSASRSVCNGCQENRCAGRTWTPPEVRRELTVAAALTPLNYADHAARRYDTVTCFGVSLTSVARFATRATLEELRREAGWPIRGG